MLSVFKHMISKRNVLIILLSVMVFNTYGKMNSFSDNKKLTWIKAIYPDHYKIQFAGGIGFVSGGLGYDFFKERVDITYFYGYVPEWYSKEDLHSVSLQLSGKPFRIELNNKLEYYPLNIGIFLHHTFGSEYYITLPDHYPEDYYWWSPGRTGGLFLEGQLNYQFKEPDHVFSEIGFYYRIVTRGVYLTSKISNTSIPIEDIFSLGLGIVIYY
jgi:hypothetical protein